MPINTNTVSMMPWLRLRHYVAKRGVRLTAIRKRVLELVWASHQPLGAYAILDKLTAEGHKPAPPTVYRSFRVFIRARFNSSYCLFKCFFGLYSSFNQHLACFFICQHCGNAEELAESQPYSKKSTASFKNLGFMLFVSLF
jgi:Fur family zinc uptake transcriptional regulator